MELTIIMISLLISINGFAYYLFQKQLKLIDKFKIGDKIIYHGQEAEILDITQDGKFVIKTVVSGMLLSKKNEQATT